MGDPADPDTQVGPVTTPPQYRKILDYLDIGRQEGAEPVLGGGPADSNLFGSGRFVQPTIFTGVTNAMRIARESGQEAIHEYLQQKSVWISTAAEVPNPFVMR